MNTTMTIRLHAWASPYCGIGPGDLETLTPDRVRVLSMLHEGSDLSGEGYALIGHAEATLTLMTPPEVVDSQVSSLRAQMAKTQADAEAKVTAIKRQINELLALPMAAVGS